MTRYKSNFDYSKELRELRTYTMELGRKKAALTAEVERLTAELELAYETLQRPFSPQ
jgi:uncharacterized small protein (DUF1192 family)